MQGHRYPFIAREGLLLIAATVLFAAWFGYSGDYRLSLAAALTAVLLYFVFRDPERRVPASALGVVSPVDGIVAALETVSTGALQGDAHQLVIRVSVFGTYAARSPVEGTVRSLASAAAEDGGDYATNALWVQTDEGDDVVMGFRRFFFGVPPKSFARYGERLGQGQRCAYLRLARHVVLHLPADSRMNVSVGQRVKAGCDLLATLPSSH